MGWGYGKLMDGRDAGYNVEAVCDYSGCDNKIDRGLAYACGGNHEAGDDYCADYFCYEHLIMTEKGQRCPDCAKLVPEEEEEDIEANGLL